MPFPFVSYSCKQDRSPSVRDLVAGQISSRLSSSDFEMKQGVVCVVLSQLLGIDKNVIIGMGLIGIIIIPSLDSHKRRECTALRKSQRYF